MKIRKLLVGALGAVAFSLSSVGGALAQQPIKVGMSMPQTGSLGAGGKAALLALQMWVEDVNAKGGLLGRKVEFIVYDDQTNPALTPAIYTKLLDIDKVDLLIAPYGTVPTAPIMPLVKQRGLLLMGNFSFQVNRTVRHDMWFNNSPWNDARSWSDGFFSAGSKLGAKTVAFLAADQEFAQNLANGARVIAKSLDLKTVYEQNYPPSTVDFSSMIRAIRAAKPDLVFVMSYPNDSVAIIRAVNEIGVGPSVKLFGGGMVGLQFTPIMQSLGSLLNGVVNYNSYVPGMKYPGIEEFLRRVLAECRQTGYVKTIQGRRRAIRGVDAAVRRGDARGAAARHLIRRRQARAGVLPTGRVSQLLHGGASRAGTADSPTGIFGGVRAAEAGAGRIVARGGNSRQGRAVAHHGRLPAVD